MQISGLNQEIRLQWMTARRLKFVIKCTNSPLCNNYVIESSWIDMLFCIIPYQSHIYQDILAYEQVFLWRVLKSFVVALIE